MSASWKNKYGSDLGFTFSAGSVTFCSLSGLVAALCFLGRVGGAAYWITAVFGHVVILYTLERRAEHWPTQVFGFARLLLLYLFIPSTVSRLGPLTRQFMSSFKQAVSYSSLYHSTESSKQSNIWNGWMGRWWCEKRTDEWIDRWISRGRWKGVIFL